MASKTVDPADLKPFERHYGIVETCSSPGTLDGLKRQDVTAKQSLNDIKDALRDAHSECASLHKKYQDSGLAPEEWEKIEEAFVALQDVIAFLDKPLTDFGVYSDKIGRARNALGSLVDLLSDIMNG